MKKGQGPLGIVVGLVVMIFLFVVIAWAFRPTATGQVVVENEEVKDGSFISAPFELRAWVVNTGGVQVDIQNFGEEDYMISSVEVKGCGVTEQGRGLKREESQLFLIKCSLNQGEKFRGILIVKYSPVDGGVETSAFGNVEDIV